MEVMYSRKEGRRYEVYGFDVENKMALCFDSAQAARSNGHGWCKICYKSLIPEKYFNKSSGEYMSVSEKNSIKRKLKLVAATWECTDGRQFDHSEIDDAIDYQSALLKEEASDDQAL